jgi:uncharacterized delta-60 repeat protein
MKRIIYFTLIPLLLILYNGLQAQAPFHLDTTFQVDMNGQVSQYEGYVTDYLVEDDESIIIAGNFWHSSNNNAPKIMARLNPDGSLAFTFEKVNFNPTCIYEFNGNYYLGSQFGPGVVRVLANGNIDSNFQFPQSSFYAGLTMVSDIYVYPDGKVLVAGWFGAGPSEFWGLLRLLNDGTIDSSFHTNIIENKIDNILPVADDKFIITGMRYDIQETRTDIWRIFPDGRLDTTFDAHISSGRCWTATAVPGTDKLIVCGEMAIPGYPQPLKLIRLYADGSLDPSFYFNNQFDELPSSLIFIGSKMLVGGTFKEINGRKYNSLAVFDTSGVLDTTLSKGLPGPDTSLPHYTHPPGAGFPKMQGDKVLVDGNTNIFSGFYSLGLIRLYGLSVGMEEKESENMMRIYPNPATLRTWIDFGDKPTDRGGTVRVFDYMGREVASFPFRKASHRIEITTSGLSPGLYIICAEFENEKTFCSKLIVSEMD